MIKEIRDSKAGYSYRRFSDVTELNDLVYESLITFLKEKGEVGKEKEESKKSEGAKSAQGKGGTQNASRSAQNGQLEAASSGVASDGGEPVLVQGFNVESPAEADLLHVLHGKYLYEGIVKSLKPQAEQVVATAVALDQNPELERILGLRRPFPTDVNGGRRG